MGRSQNCRQSFMRGEAAVDEGVRDALDTMKLYSRAAEMNREIVGTLIDKVLVYDPECIEIRWKFLDEVMKFIGT